MRPETASLHRLGTVFYAVVALLAWGWAAWFDSPLFGDRAPTASGLGAGLLVGLGIVALCHACYRLSRAARRASRVLAGFFGPIGIKEALWLALISGFGEELAFRGALWPQLGLVGTSIFFAVLHVVPMRALAGYPFFALFAGLALGLLREKTGSVWPPMVAHTTINALNIAYLGHLQRRSGKREPPQLFTPPEPTGPAAPAEPASSVPPTTTEEPLVFDETAEESFPLTVWRYDLRVEPTGTDREALPDCLEHENLCLFTVVPRETVRRELRDGLFVFAHSFPEPWPGFAADIAAISAYLFEPVIGIEVAERYVDESTTDDVRAWKIVALRGEWVKVPILVPPPEEGRFVVDPDHEDTEVIVAHWQEYPRWFQDGMRFKYPRLRDL